MLSVHVGVNGGIKLSYVMEEAEVVQGIPREERVVTGADFNGHVGEGNSGDVELMGRYGRREMNAMSTVNSYFKNEEEHMIHIGVEEGVH